MPPSALDADDWSQPNALAGQAGLVTHIHYVVDVLVRLVELFGR
jgi:hypothetical protein